MRLLGDKNVQWNERTGVNHPNSDFDAGGLETEVKNLFRPLDSPFIEKRVLPKNPAILICPRIYESARELAESNGIIVIETEKQLVSKQQWKEYSSKKQNHSTYAVIEWVQRIRQQLKKLFGIDGGSSAFKDKEVTKGDDNKLLLLEMGVLTIETDSGDPLFAMLGGEIQENIPFMGELKICENCNRLHYKEGRFCSMKCFHDWGGPKRVLLEREEVA